MQILVKIAIFLLGSLLPASKPCLTFYSSKSVSDLPACLTVLPQLEPKIKLVNVVLRRPALTSALTLLDETKPVLPYLDYLLGQNKPLTYLVLLQNDHEMRANGGFFGSYAVVTVDKKQSNFRFQDIYVPDGALIGHVDPPAPIQTAFKQGWFKLRDADWEPDFPTAATTIRWFLTKGNEINPDVLVTLNLTTIEKIMAIVGEVDVPEYNFKLNSDNLYTLLQNQAEINFFPGSTQKKDVLSAAGRAVTKKLSTLTPDQYQDIANLLLSQLKHADLLVNSTNSNFQSVLENQNWAGKLTLPACHNENCTNDTTLLIETNLGANKANCCVERTTSHILTKNDSYVSHLINLSFDNQSPLENPLPPRFYGGNYISYLRFYIPDDATNIRLTAQPTFPKTLREYPTPFDGLNQKTFDLKSNYGLREIGFFHITAAATKSTVQLSYDLPLLPNSTSYQLNLLKQNGFEKSPQQINLFGSQSTTTLDSPYTVSTKL